MKALHALLSLLAGGLVVEASFSHVGHASQHAKLARNLQPTIGERETRINKRCSAVRVPTATSSTHSTTPSSTYSAPPKASTHALAVAPSSGSSPSSSSSSGSSSSALIKVGDNVACGASGAQTEVTATNGPNGKIDWLNCGINSGGWNPPFVTVSDIVSQYLPDAVKQPNSAFSACSAYIDIFEQYGNQFGVPSILLASFAMQESGCNPSTVGGAGEQGLMQLTADKCGNAPGGNCKDPNYNIMTGAQYFSDTLNGNGGDLLLTIGGYNGWYKGLTYAEATAAGTTSCCRCQNNLDYLQQFMNGWLQNINAYSNNPPLGEYFNLNHCTD